MRCGHLRPDPGGAPWDDGEGEAHRVDAEIDEPGREGGGGDLVADHDRHDRVLAGKDVEAELGHARPEMCGVVAQSVAELCRGLDQLERPDAGCDHRRGHAVGEEVGAGGPGPGAAPAGGARWWERGWGGGGGGGARPTPGGRETNPPLAPPIALPSVPVRMSTRSLTPWCSGVPRPPGPTTPTACESSTITSA